MGKFSIALLEENQVLNTANFCTEDHSDWSRAKSASDKCNHCHPVVPWATAYGWKSLACTIPQKTHLTLDPDSTAHVSPQGSKRAEILLRI